VLARFHEARSLVEVSAWQLHRTIGSRVTIEELKSYGAEALLLAARSFDPERGVPFRRWASMRIRGGMIDGLRAMSELPTRVRRRLESIKSADAVEEALVIQDAARPPGTSEVEEERLADHLARLATALALGLVSEPTTAEGEVLDRDLSPEEKVAWAELVQEVREAVERLPERDSALVRRHYLDGVTLEAAAQELGISVGWASRAFGAAMERLTKDLRRRIGR
jgi:RNA polymerase sigma factor for flagellar operon FliA